MPMSDPSSSFDDLRLLAKERRPHFSDERRVRSCSPVKSHRNVPGSLNDLNTFKLPAIDHDIISLSTSSTSGSIQEQLKILSKSPISKRLQISDSSKYTIPIPFTLQLPPKLSKGMENIKYNSPPGSPASEAKKSPSPKPKRLFYTGTGYHMVDSDLETEKKQEKQKNHKLPKRPSSNCIQSLKFKVLSKDDLSIIEEMSNSSTSSRKSSIKSQSINGFYPIGKSDLLKRKIDKSSISYSSPFIGGSKSVYPISSSYLSYLDDQSYSELKPKSLIFSENSKSTKVEEENEIDHRSSGHTITKDSTSEINKSPTKRALLGNSIKQKPLPQINSIQSENTSVSESDTLYNDIYHLKYVSPTRFSSSTSTASDSTVDSNSSLASLQESIDITNVATNSSHNKGYISAYDLADSIISEGMLSDCLMQEEETKPLNISRGTTLKTIDKGETKEEETTDFVAKKNEEYNIGTGKTFSFPNSSENVTNSKEAKEKFKLSTLSSSHHSIQTNLSEASGQIEIPNLSDLDDSSIHTKEKSKSTSSVWGLTFDDLKSDTSYSSETTINKSITKLEPIGIPTKAAQRVIKDQFKYMHQESECGSDSDTETDNHVGALSLYNNQRLSKSTSDVFEILKAQQDNKDGARSVVSDNISASRSFPIRHARHKSMFNIEFDMNREIKSPNHKRGKSVDFKELSNRPLPKLPKDPVEPVTKIPVEDPPIPIMYPVDFKESNMNDAKLLNSTYSSKTKSIKASVIDNDRRNIGWYNHSIENRLDDFSSESSSSYQSSRSARYTNSTMSDVSDTDSVFIDLTKDNYDVCTVLRNNSTTSYKSVTEKANNGKEYEIVIVDDADSDELASIYSKYKQNWVTRKNSTTSNQSSTSSMSFGGSVASINQIHLKEHDGIRDRKSQLSNNLTTHLYSQRSNTSTSSTVSSVARSYTSQRIKLPHTQHLIAGER